MGQFAFYDFETTGTSPAFDQALQFAAILTDENLNPLEEINVRCNLSNHILPSPIAFSVTGITPDVLNSQEMSYYDFSIYLYNLIARWSLQFGLAIILFHLMKISSGRCFTKTYCQKSILLNSTAIRDLIF